MYGLIGKIHATPGQRDALAEILLSCSHGEPMPGCLSYVVATDPTDDDALWITEVWIDATHHAASLKIDRVQAAITAGRPLIASFSEHHEITPLGGTGLTAH